MNSHNHQMFGSVVDWFFGDIAGITTLPEPGYPQVTIAPKLDKTHELTSAEAYVDTVRGPRVERVAHVSTTARDLTSR